MPYTVNGYISDDYDDFKSQLIEDKAKDRLGAIGYSNVEAKIKEQEKRIKELEKTCNDLEKILKCMYNQMTHMPHLDIKETI